MVKRYAMRSRAGRSVISVHHRSLGRGGGSPVHRVLRSFDLDQVGDASPWSSWPAQPVFAHDRVDQLVLTIIS